MPWIIDVLAGLMLAALLYALVRVRMLVAPIARERYGASARWAIWAIIAVLMVIVANLELMGLREILHGTFGVESSLLHELLFAVVALAGGYFLVARYVIGKPRDKNSGKGC